MPDHVVTVILHRQKKKRMAARVRFGTTEAWCSLLARLPVARFVAQSASLFSTAWTGRLAGARRRCFLQKSTAVPGVGLTLMLLTLGAF
jgi:hypothetical protein